MKKENNNYEYPIDYDWSTEEITNIIKFYNVIEEAYEGGVDKNKLLSAYNDFRKIVPMKMDQNNLSKRFETESGYSIYKVIKAAQGATIEYIKF
ncbi:UPF0223 protein [Companilactobacillus sp. RD055328]|uniref:UPF0223 family protein n=1 Tax=Companilactobacillus sp. RD055328 TaxID=2916634 RepID=UPI001FC86CEC|nr:UPF0223 family protein [Companilactobacillus sp. RD055328]GKQ42821.1 UPF0223 protein [Companilactobacillus sp. RD055328]